MNQYFKYTTCVFIALSILPCVFSIKCWDCRSKYDPKCGEPFDNTTLSITDCNREKDLESHLPTLCRKIKQKVNGEWEHLRNCASSKDVPETNFNDETFCYTEMGTNNIVREICMCKNKDGCNSSNIFSPLTLLLAMLFCLPYLRVKIIIQ